ncbi:MAG: ABC transporter ATP-binding protein [Clostridia bacterium]|nr:ABC transporter ATP-binding protein [Clostridia bacterium]
MAQNRAKKMQIGKAKNFKKAIKNLFQFSKKYLPIIIIALTLSVIASVLAVIGPNKLRDLTNEIQLGIMGTINMTNVLNIMYVLIAVYLTSSTFMAVQNLIMAKVSQGVSKKMRTEIDKKINRVPIKFVDSVAHGDLLSSVTNDVDTISQGLNSSIGTLVHSSTLLVATLIMMFVTNAILAATTILCSLLGFVLIAIIIAKSQKHFVAQQAGLAKVNAHIEEIYTGHSIVKLYNATKEETQKFEALNTSLFKSAFKSQFLGGLMMPIMNFIGNFGYVAVCVVGAALVLNGKTDIGTIFAFIMYARIFSNQLTQLSQSLGYMQSTAAASERVFELLGQEEMQDESHKTKQIDTQSVKGNVKFENICFGYDKDKPVIKDFSIEIKPGQKVAIVGKTGAGKTTIVNLLMRFYELDSGNIYIDGINTKDITRENIHDLFGMVLQDTWLFDGTLRENLVFNKQNITDEEIMKVCDVCGLNHYINSLPNGLDTVLDSNLTISAGQKQLLTIARAMIQNSPMIILDEATSSVDTRTEILIQKAMDNLSKGRTSFVIAHRLSTIKNADVIIVMQDGQIVEYGNHDALLAKNGIYHSLYNSQFEE